MIVTVHAPVNYSALFLTHVSIALAASHIDFRPPPPERPTSHRSALDRTSFDNQWATFIVFKAGLKFGSELGNRRGQ
jgi:hypothetical protein